MHERKLLIGMLGGLENEDQELRVRNGLSKHYGPHGFDVITHAVGWYDTSQSIDQKFERLTAVMPTLTTRYDSIAAIGPSAGGLAAVAGLLFVPEITAAVAISSPLQLRYTPDTPQRRAMIRACPAIIPFEEGIQGKLGTDDHTHDILTLSVERGDDLLPLDTTQLPRARNHVVNFEAEGHTSAIRYLFHDATTVGVVVDFLANSPTHKQL